MEYYIKLFPKEICAAILDEHNKTLPEKLKLKPYYGLPEEIFGRTITTVFIEGSFRYPDKDGFYIPLFFIQSAEVKKHCALCEKYNICTFKAADGSKPCNMYKKPWGLSNSVIDLISTLETGIPIKAKVRRVNRRRIRKG